MTRPLSERILERIGQASGLYHRLVLVVAPAGTGKTAALRAVADDLRVPLVNVNLELSRRLLDLTVQQRALRVPRLLELVASETPGLVVGLDNLEILFDCQLAQDPLRLLQKIARNRTVVAAWGGTVDGDYITYATPEHPEWRRYPISGFLVVGADAPADDAGAQPRKDIAR